LKFSQNQTIFKFEHFINLNNLKIFKFSNLKNKYKQNQNIKEKRKKEMEKKKRKRKQKR
jgi:hypothetical protein